MPNPISNDYYKLASYAAAANINHNTQADLQSQLLVTGGLMLAPTAYKLTKGAVWDAPRWVWQNKGDYTSAWQQIKANNEAAKKSVEHLKGKNIFETINNRSHFNQLTELEKNLKTAPDYRDWSKLKTVSGEIKAVTKRGKAWAGVKKYSGYNAVDGAMKKGATSSSKVVRGIAKGAKGGGLATAAIGLACETPDIIETYKKGGAGKGTKQLAKSAGIAAAEGVGFAVGAKVGAIAGAKIGATIGTCIGGPVGTAVGGAVGAIVGVGCGILGSWLAGKGARALAGKSELQKINEEEAKKLAENAQKNNEGKEELLAKAEERANLEGCTDEEVIEAYRKIVNDKNTEIKKSKKTSDKSRLSSDYSSLYNLLSGLANYQMPVYSPNTIYTNNILTPSFNNTFNPYYSSYNNIFNSNMMYNPLMQNLNFGLYA